MSNKFRNIENQRGSLNNERDMKTLDRMRFYESRAKRERQVKRVNAVSQNEIAKREREYQEVHQQSGVEYRKELRKTKKIVKSIFITLAWYKWLNKSTQ